MGVNAATYVLSKKYTDETAEQFGGLKGASCKIKSIVKSNGRNTVTFEWKNDSGETRESTMTVLDGTPIYEWQSGDHYVYSDLVIYASAFYRCTTENEDVEFDATKWAEIGSPDGNFDIVQTSEMLPVIFTAADRKMYYCIEDEDFYLWNGTAWVKQTKAAQYTVMPTAGSDYEGKVIQYVGDTTQTYTKGYFYECIEDSENPGIYIWQRKNTQPETDLTDYQTKELENPITVDGQEQTTVEGALEALNNKTVDVDSELSGQSENPVQNKVITAALEEVSQADTLADWNAVFGSEFNPTTNVEVPSVTSLDLSDVVYEND